MFVRKNYRIEYVVDDKVLAFVTFPKLNDNTVIINHTVVDPSLRGQGIASMLMDEVILFLKENNLKVRPSCSYARSWFEKHQEYNDLLE